MCVGDGGSGGRRGLMVQMDSLHCPCKKKIKKFKKHRRGGDAMCGLFIKLPLYCV